MTEPKIVVGDVLIHNNTYDPIEIEQITEDKVRCTNLTTACNEITPRDEFIALLISGEIRQRGADTIKKGRTVESLKKAVLLTTPEDALQIKGVTEGRVRYIHLGTGDLHLVMKKDFMVMLETGGYKALFPTLHY